MKITKYEHACFTAEKEGFVLVVDPGDWTSDFIVPENVVGIVITHEHGDHFNPDALAAIFNKNPNSILVSLSGIVAKMPDHKSQAVQPGDKVEIGPFTLEFFGGQHAIIHNSVPVIDNIGVLIDDTLYYPGDSFIVPNKPVGVLALPTSAPWLKIGEVIDFFAAVKPSLAFPTHDILLSDIGKASVDSRLTSTAGLIGSKYQRINGTSIEI